MSETTVYGYKIYLGDQLVAVSDTLYPSQEEVKKELLANILSVCQAIADEDKEGRFVWDSDFDPNDTYSCSDFDQCFINYQAVKHIIEFSKAPSDYAKELNLYYVPFHIKDKFEETT